MLPALIAATLIAAPALPQVAEQLDGGGTASPLPEDPVGGEVPDGPQGVHLKDHEDLKLAWEEGRGFFLSAQGDHWRFEPGAEESLEHQGAFRVVHHDTGLCMVAGPLGPDGVNAPLELADCADAAPWSIVYDDRPSHADFRFATPEGYLLGLAHTESKEEHVAVPAEGVEVFAVNVPESLHSQEWLFAAPPPSGPPSTPPTEVQSSPEVPSESPKPTLPTTGAALGLGIGAGAVALVGGAALVLWWQRRRALRADW